jgi:hypothetical protein
MLNVSNASSQLVAITCFNSCGACPEFQDITFAVNMANVLVSSNGVHLAGGFGAYGYANWSPSGIVMTDPDGNGVYTAVLTLPAGQTFEYKFINGNDWPGAEGVPAECNTFSNRVYTVPTYDAIAGGAAVCFGACSACLASVNNDSPYSATNVLFSSNNSFPNCYAINGSTASAGDSPQSSEYNGNDVWYRFTAQSTGVSITLSSTSQDDALALYSKSGEVFNLVPGSSENAAIGAGDFERLNFSGLTPGQVYFVSVGSASSASSGAFSLCIQHLMPSTCATIVPAAGFNLCDSYKASFRGAPSQGVTYTFNFTPTGATGGSATSLSGTNGLITLSNPTLALRYAGTYAASVDVRYNLLNGAGTAEPVDVLGSAGGNCANVVMRAQPNNEVRGTQRCNASLLRSNWLVGNSVTGDPKACGVQSYTYEFTQVVSCADGTTISVLPSLYNTTGATPYLQLGVLPNLGNTGAWNVRIRPNFSYGDGTFGPVQRIQVAGTTASGELEYELADAEKELEVDMATATIYPNPSNGEFMNVTLSDLEKGELQVRVLDAAGRSVTSRVFAVEGSFYTTLTFDEKLNAGVYMIETRNAGRVQTQRLVVQ